MKKEKKPVIIHLEFHIYKSKEKEFSDDLIKFIEKYKIKSLPIKVKEEVEDGS